MDKEVCFTVDDQCSATGLKPSGINNISNNDTNTSNLYSMNGTMVKANASDNDIKTLKKGIYIINKKKFVKK